MFESICNDRFFLSVFRPRTDIKSKTVTCYAARHRFFKLVLYKLFHFRQESYDDFLTKTVLPILLISPHDVIFCLNPFGPQDKWAVSENRGGEEIIVLHQP